MVQFLSTLNVLKDKRKEVPMVKFRLMGTKEDMENVVV